MRSPHDEILRRESTPAEDLALVRRALAREPGAVGALAAQLGCIPRILRALNGRMGSTLTEHDLADVGQDVAMIVLDKLPEYEGRSALEGWIFRICSLELMNALRRKKKLRPSLDETGPDAAGGPVAPAADPWRYEELHRGLARLKAEEAEVVRLKHFAELTFDEIGAALGISANTAKTRYYRALDNLHAAIARDGRRREA